MITREELLKLSSAEVRRSKMNYESFLKYYEEDMGKTPSVTALDQCRACAFGRWFKEWKTAHDKVCKLMEFSEALLN